MINKIVFIQPSIQHPRSIKRIEEFIENGYNVEVFGFQRKNYFIDQRKISYNVSCIGEFENELSYVKRMPLLYKAIKNVVNKFKSEKVVFYLFGLDVALIYRLISNKPYIYEESDLAHTYIDSAILRRLLEYADCKVIKKSLLSVFTSEGFVQYHFGNNRPSNIALITNRLHRSVLDLKSVEKSQIDMNHIKFGFVGAVRFDAIMSFAETVVSKFPQHEFHFFGGIEHLVAEKCNQLDSYPNCHFHGKFSSPMDLPVIYSKIDLVLSTYDVTSENVRYAEPNKFYESIYFETPIIVSKGTYLADHVKELGIGYDVDASNQDDVVSFINSLSLESINEKIKACRLLPKACAVNDNSDFFERLKTILNH